MRALLALFAVGLAACSTGTIDDPTGAEGSTELTAPTASASGDDAGSGFAAEAGGGGAEDTGATGKPACGASEICGNGLDDDCDGQVDEGCDCARGATQKCYVGAPEKAGVGACAFGTQTCEAAGEFGTWGACTGSGVPSAEVCDGIDNDCDGVVDEELTRSCYDGPPGSDKLPGCKTGTQTCSAGAWGKCEGEVSDCAPPCIGGGTPGSSPWQISRNGGPVCFGTTFSVHGEKGEYGYSSIPSESDSGWAPITATTIDFSEGSAMCGRGCDCLNGGEFTYFQTFFDIPKDYAVSSLLVSFSGVDDGARVTVFNSSYPGGVVDDGTYIYIGGSPVTSNLAKYLVPGKNRIVITHVDDCCSWRSLTGVKVSLNGTTLGKC